MMLTLIQQNPWLKRAPYGIIYCWGLTFSVWTQFTVRTGKKVATREEWHCSQARQRFKRSKGVKLNGILECRSFVEKRAPDAGFSSGHFLLPILPWVHELLSQYQSTP